MQQMATHALLCVYFTSLSHLLPLTRFFPRWLQTRRLLLRLANEAVASRVRFIR